MAALSKDNWKQLWDACSAWAGGQVRSHPVRTFFAVATVASPSVVTWPVTLGMAIGTALGSLSYEGCENDYSSALVGGIASGLLGVVISIGGAAALETSSIPACVASSYPTTWLNQTKEPPVLGMEVSYGVCKMRVESMANVRKKDLTCITANVCVDYPKIFGLTGNPTRGKTCYDDVPVGLNFQ